MAEIKIPLPTNEQMAAIGEKMDKAAKKTADRYKFEVDKVNTSVTTLQAMDKRNGTLWARFGNSLRKSTDSGETWMATGTVILGTKEGANITAREIMVTPNGNLLASTSPIGGLGGWIYRSTDEGATWIEVYDWNVAEGNGSYILAQGWDIHPNYDGQGNAAIYVTEYNTNANPAFINNKLKVLRSTDDGATFTVISEISQMNSGIRHWHFVVYDEFDNKLWLGSGDLAPHCHLYEITDGITLNHVGGGTYDWKFVSVVPYKGVLYCPSDRTDTGAVPCPAYLFNKRTKKLEILGYADGHAWYSCMNKKHGLPFWMNQVNQAVSTSGDIKGYTADYDGVYEVFSASPEWGTATVPSSLSFAWGDYIFVNMFNSNLNPGTTAFLRLKIVERGAEA